MFRKKGGGGPIRPAGSKGPKAKVQAGDNSPADQRSFWEKIEKPVGYPFVVIVAVLCFVYFMKAAAGANDKGLWDVIFSTPFMVIFTAGVGACLISVFKRNVSWTPFEAMVWVTMWGGGILLVLSLAMSPEAYQKMNLRGFIDWTQTENVSESARRNVPQARSWTTIASLDTFKGSGFGDEAYTRTVENGKDYHYKDRVIVYGCGYKVYYQCRWQRTTWHPELQQFAFVFHVNAKGKEGKAIFVQAPKGDPISIEIQRLM